MKIAAYQAPLLPSGSLDALPLIQQQITRCEAAGVDILCCPEAVFGGLADYAQNPADFAFDLSAGELEKFLSPLASDTVSLIVGFTEATPDGRLYNAAAVLHKGRILGVYRKVYPAINRSVYSPGDQLPVFDIGPLRFGIVICNDSNYIEPTRVLAAKGATVLFIPTNNALRPEKADVVCRARNAQAARAFENGLTVIAADVAGRCDGLIAYGSSNIIDPDGTVLASSKPLAQDLLIADIQPVASTKRRGWDAARNPAVVKAFLRQCYADNGHSPLAD